MASRHHERNRDAYYDGAELGWVEWWLDTLLALLGEALRCIGALVCWVVRQLISRGR